MENNSNAAERWASEIGVKTAAASQIDATVSNKSAKPNFIVIACKKTTIS